MVINIEQVQALEGREKKLFACILKYGEVAKATQRQLTLC
jgi:hypothetical protein